MIHDRQRVESLRARTTEQLQLLSTLEAKINKGTLPGLQPIRNQLGDIENFFLDQLNGKERTPYEEARWLDDAEWMLQITTAELKQIETQFNQLGPGKVDVIG